MEASLSTDGDAVTVAFAGRLTATTAARCAEALRSALAAAPRLTLAFGEVEAADLTFLQLLCAAHRSAAAAGGAVALAGRTPAALAELLARAGAERCAEGPPGCVLRGLRAAAAPGR